MNLSLSTDFISALFQLTICFYWFSRLILVNDNPAYEQIFLNVKLEKINLNQFESVWNASLFKLQH